MRSAILIVTILPLLALFFAVRTRAVQKLHDAKIEPAESGRLSMRARACYKPATFTPPTSRAECNAVPIVSSPPMSVA